MKLLERVVQSELVLEGKLTGVLVAMEAGLPGKCHSRPHQEEMP